MTHRRIKARHVAQGETALIAAAIAGEQRHGFIDGVEVDFRHPDLPTSDWEAAAWWYVWGKPPRNAGIIFPAEAELGLDALREAKGMSSASLVPVFAHAGDKVSILNVVPKIEDRRFDHPHDSQQRLAYLQVERPSGEIVCPSGPLGFYGTTQIRNGALRETFDHVLARICRQAKVAELYDRDPQHGDKGSTPFWNLAIEDIALVAAQEAHDAFFRLAASLPPEGEADAKLGHAHLRKLANSAALAGFLLSKGEAQKAEKVGSGVMLNLAKATAARTNDAWRDRATAIWRDNPDWTTHRVAKDVAEPDDDLSSVQRAIKKLAPSTSPSFKKA